MTTLLKLDHVSTAYGQSRVLWDIDLDVAEGSAVALIGRNGGRQDDAAAVDHRLLETDQRVNLV
ncbi:MAG TPA: hypothetical protein VIF02_13645 [Methylocella sp.]|jgi:ABC-type uncharacterized transport system ATPase subunit